MKLQPNSVLRPAGPACAATITQIYEGTKRIKRVVHRGRPPKGHPRRTTGRGRVPRFWSRARPPTAHAEVGVGRFRCIRGRIVFQTRMINLPAL
jgi:hypothetical protein